MFYTQMSNNETEGNGCERTARALHPKNQFKLEVENIKMPQRRRNHRETLEPPTGSLWVSLRVRTQGVHSPLLRGRWWIDESIAQIRELHPKVLICTQKINSSDPLPDG